MYQSQCICSEKSLEPSFKRLLNIEYVTSAVCIRLPFHISVCLIAYARKVSIQKEDREWERERKNKGSETERKKNARFRSFSAQRLQLK